jgi:hypothetical protein
MAHLLKKLKQKCVGNGKRNESVDYKEKEER